MNEGLLPIIPGEAIPLSKIPHLHFYDFYNEVLAQMEDGAKVVQYFAFNDPVVDRKQLLLVLRKAGMGNRLLLALAYATNEYLAFSVHHKKFHLFERELYETEGIRPIGHPSLHPVRKQIELYPFYCIHGHEVHEVGVGPVHAGVIEPGHFRFSAVGERVHLLEIQLGYQHRGVEQLLLKSATSAWPMIIEGIAGDSAVSNALCWVQAMEALANISVSRELKIVRTLAVELERLSNHVGDLGALSNDVAFLPAAAYFGRMRGEFLNLLLLLSGNRFGKGLLVPGALRFELSSESADLIRAKIDEITPEIKSVGKLLFTTPSVQSRFERIGVLQVEQAQELGVVGITARASGIDYDVRVDYPRESYSELNLPIRTQKGGDVWGRAMVRFEEILDSLGAIKTLLGMLGRIESSFLQPSHSNAFANAFAPSSVIVTLNEGWRGELSHAAVTDGAGKIIRYKIKDPSFHNWNALAQVMRESEISDFPLCNKSFNLSYCGFDL
ncbi:MAG: hydrogenase [Oligoflexia bacterium]|nr:hydrogenase [Oligoflexia bacterium]